MKKLRYIFMLCFVVSLVVSNGYASAGDIIKHERLISFEEPAVPAFITSPHGKLAISGLHYKDGKNSLLWDYSANATLSIKKDLHFEHKDASEEDTYLSTFTVWVYNPKAIDAQIEFQFLRDSRLCTSFSYNINFEGWRAIYVSYDRDMQGKPEEGMNEIRVKAPSIAGQLYFDMLLTSAKTDRRHHTPDIHQPFVNKGTTNHWLACYNNSLIEPDKQLYNSDISALEKKEIEVMEKRLVELIVSPTTVTDKAVAALEERFEKYRIVENNATITGLPLFYIYYAESYERLFPNWSKDYHRAQGQEFRDYFTLMQHIANAYVNAVDTGHKTRLKEMFLLMYDHAKDQGVAYGSNMGNFSHYGYSFRWLFTSYFLMKDVLLHSGRLADATKALQWYAQTNETFTQPTRNGVDMDSFNTFSMGRICSILIMENSPEKTQYIRAFSRWLDTGCKPAPGLDGAFKADGSAFHHRNNYPAYAVGGLDGATNMLYILSQTSFAVSQLAHETVRNVLMTMRFYCNTSHFPLSMSGRHPDGKGELVPMHFARMAMSGTPDKQAKVDREMASAFLRLTSTVAEDQPEYMPKANKAEVKKMTKFFKKLNIEPETDPVGNKAMGYASVSIHRRSNWSAVVRGHSRYLWAAEHYQGANLYGRYLAHGSMQIMTAKPHKRVTPASSGWVEKGFDWGRIPGTTAIHLPIEELKANVLNVDTYSGYEEMLYSDEAFAGGLSQNASNGLYAMKLHEHDKYNGSHRARKSFHFFDDRIVCLGTDIENQNADYRTETTVFQLALTDEQQINYWKDTPSSPEYWIDHLGTGYFVPKKTNKKVIFENNKHQHSRYQNTGKENVGHWVSLVLDHGIKPQNETYEYVVLPQTNTKLADVKDIRNSYQILQHNSEAHIVKDRLGNRVSFAFFETPKAVVHSILVAVDTSCLVMIDEGDKRVLDVTVANPDLALYRGDSDDVLDEHGKRIERSIYSRPWIGENSQIIPVTLTLKGKWEVAIADKAVSAKVEGGYTILTFECNDARSINTKLNKL